MYEYVKLFGIFKHCVLFITHIIITYCAGLNIDDVQVKCDKQISKMKMKCANEIAILNQCIQDLNNKLEEGYQKINENYKYVNIQIIKLHEKNEQLSNMNILTTEYEGEIEKLLNDKNLFNGYFNALCKEIILLGISNKIIDKIICNFISEWAIILQCPKSRVTVAIKCLGRKEANKDNMLMALKEFEDFENV